VKLDIIYNMDCLKGMKKLPDNSIDQMVTDPPYGIAFMGRAWDKAIPSVNIWREALRVLKPGAFAFVMCIPRQDCLARMIVSLEDAGFKIGFTPISWCFASGFPKSLNIVKNISKRIDKLKPESYSWITKRNEEILCNLKNVNIVDEKSRKNQIKAGINIKKSDFVVANVARIGLGKIRQLLNVIIAELNLKEVNLLSEEKTTVQENVEVKLKRKSLNANNAVKNLETQKVSMGYIAPNNVIIYQCKKTMDRIKEDGAQKIELGNLLLSKEMVTNVNFVGLIETLKYIILSQSKTFQGLDINYQMELLTAIDVIITKSTMECLITKMENILVKKLQGSYGGAQLKPSLEIILVAMKPLSEKTYVDQALRNGKGITWLDEGRIPYKSEQDRQGCKVGFDNENDKSKVYELGHKEIKQGEMIKGRFPANLLVSDDVLNDGRNIKSGWLNKDKAETKIFGTKNKLYGGEHYGDAGSFSRYFSLDAWFDKRLKELPKGVQKTFPFLIVPKASKAEKNRGCEGLPIRQLQSASSTSTGKRVDNRKGRKDMEVKPNLSRNYHPTVKPIKLFSYLITLGSREGDIILDPFIGSGTTAIAAKMLKRHYIGYETEADYCEIAKARVSAMEDMLF